MKVYLAAPYGSRTRIRGYADQLREDGFTCTSSWLDETHDISAGTQGAASSLPDETVAGHALQDLIDITGSDVLVLFTSAAVGVEGGGGRHVEPGYAYALDTPIVVVGPPENVFHRIGLPQVQVVANWDAARESLARRYAGECVVCGCGEYSACVGALGNCHWVASNLCSGCA